MTGRESHGSALSITKCCLGKLCHTCGYSRYVSFECGRNQTLSVAACCQRVSQLFEQLASCASCASSSQVTARALCVRNGAIWIMLSEPWASKYIARCTLIVNDDKIMVVPSLLSVSKFRWDTKKSRSFDLRFFCRHNFLFW
jgi:hypothetical protein